MIGRRFYFVLLCPFLVLYSLLVFLPVLGLLQKSFVTERTLEIELFQPSKLRMLKWTFENYRALLVNTYYRRSVLNTLIVASIAVSLTLIFGTPIGYVLARPGLPGRRIFEWIFSLPMFLSAVVACYAIFIVSNRQGLLTLLANYVLGRPVHLLRTFSIIIVGTVYILLPMFIRMVRPGFEKINPELWEASYSLGATEFYTFLKIVVPLALPSIVAGTILSFTYTMGLVVVALILGPTPVQFSILPLEVFEKARGLDLNIPLATAMGAVLLVVGLVGQAAAEKILRHFYLYEGEKQNVSS